MTKYAKGARWINLKTRKVYEVLSTRTAADVVVSITLRWVDDPKSAPLTLSAEDLNSEVYMYLNKEG